MVALVGMMLILSMLFGCGGGPAPTTDGNLPVITFMGWTNATESKAYDAVIKKFEEAYRCDVKYNKVAVGEYRTKLNSAMADATGNSTPDVFYVPAGMLWNLIISEKVVNLQPYLDASDKIRESDLWELPGWFQYRFDGNEIGKGDIYAFPKDVGPWAMVYNKTLFEQFGVPLPDPDEPWTWDDLIAQGAKFNHKTGTMRDAFALAWLSVYPTVWSNGASFLSEDRRTVTVTDPKFVEAIQFISDCINVHNLTPSPDESSSMDAYTRWVQGQVAICNAGPWDVTTYDKLPFEWEYMPYIAGPSGIQATTVGYMGLAVSSQSDNRDLAFELARYLTTDLEAQRSLYKAGQIVPNVVSMAKGEYVDYVKNQAPVRHRNVFEWIRILEDYGRPQEEYLTFNNEWMQPFMSGVGMVFNGSRTALEFLQEVEPTMQQKLDESYELERTTRQNTGWMPRE